MPSVKVTVPAVTGLPPLVTVAVNVTLAPVVDGFSDEVTAVEVATAASSVVIVRLQPPLIDPMSPVASSTMYRLQVPLGLVPENAAASVRCVLGAGAGDGNESAPAAPPFVGL